MGKKGRKRAAPVVAGNEGGRCEVECIDRCLRRVDGTWLQWLAYRQRRRPSFLMYSYFAFWGSICLGIFIFALVLYLVFQNEWHTVNEDCLTPFNVTTNYDMMQITLEGEVSIICQDKGDNFEIIGEACERSDGKALQDVALASGIIMAGQAGCILFLALSFRCFTNLPQEQLQHGKTNWLSYLLGCICKMLPWYNRLFHFAQIVVLLALSGMLLIGNYCRGNLPTTWNCRNFFKNCAYNKYKNCRYYYKICSPDEAKFLDCGVAVNRAEFSGRVDVRLLTHDQCMRCEMLSADQQLAADEDEFYMLDDSDRGTPAWNCKSDASFCFFSRVWSSIACNCGTAAADLIDATTLATLTASCGGGRLLNESGLRQPIGAQLVDLDLDDRERHKDYQNWNVLTELLPIAWIPRNLDFSTILHQRHDLHLPAIAKGRKRLLQNATANTPVVLTQGAPLSQQQCSWAPSEPEDYWFGSENCATAQSYLYRFTLIFCYFTATFWLGMFGCGRIISRTILPEPWFYQPQAPNESCPWRWCRLLGP